MTYSVYQHWDPLKVIGVGKSYPPELYDYIKDDKVRRVFQRIAEETEEDYQTLQALLEKLGAEVFRVDVDPMVEQAKQAIKEQRTITRPYFMQPRDYSIMLGETFHVLDEPCMTPLTNACLRNNNKVVYESPIGHQGDNMGTLSFSDIYLNGAMVSRIGKDIIVGTADIGTAFGATIYEGTEKRVQDMLPDYRVHVADSMGHLDGTYCPVVPGLIVSVLAGYDYEKTFPGWEVVYLDNESNPWDNVESFMKLKISNHGKWWVPGEELNTEFTEYVESWMNHWVGYVEESVFDVNMLVVDQKNVVVNGYNQKVFDAFAKRDITPHICNFRHRYFWDGGLHCITTDLHREGTLQDYFPERNL